MQQNTGMGNDAFNLQKDQKATRHAGSHFDFSGADKDLEVLLAKARRIRDHVNKRVAHFDRAGFAELPTYAELDECLDYLEDLLKKYLAVFGAEGHTRIVPVWQFDWKEIFRRPWIGRDE